MRRRRDQTAVLLFSCLVLVTVAARGGHRVSTPPAGFGQQAQQQAASSAEDARSRLAEDVSPADEQAIKDLVGTFYDARVRKDIAAYAQLWCSKAPRRVLPVFPPEYVFPYERLEAGTPALSRLGQQADTITARVMVPVVLTLHAGEAPTRTTWIRNMAFMKENGTWRVWREAAAADDLAVEISRATSTEERDKLLAGEPDLAGEELALALEGQADRLFLSGQPAVMELYELELKIGDETGSVAAAARAHLKLGQFLQLSRRNAPAVVDHFSKALAGFAELGDTERQARAEIGLATTFYMDDNQASRDHYQAAVKLLEGGSDEQAIANALHGLGNACLLVGDLTASFDSYARALSILRESGATLGVPALLQALGRVQKEMGDYDAAAASYQESMANPDLLDPVTHVNGLTGLADVLRLEGRCDVALASYDRALAMLQPGDKQRACTIQADIGNVYMTEQQPAAARDHYEKSLSLAANPVERARALAGLGSALFAAQSYDAALDAYRQTLDLRVKTSDKAGMAWAHAHIGLVQSALEAHADALESYGRAFEIATELNDPAAIAATMTLMAMAHAELGNASEALDFARRAAESARSAENPDTFAHARVVTARVLKEKGDYDGAEQALLEAAAAVEAGRALSGDEPGDDFFGDARAPYRAMAVLESATGKPQDALLSAERSQVRGLADLLAPSRVLIAAGMSKEEREEERRLNRTARSLRLQVARERDSAAPNPERLGGLKAKLAETDAQRKKFADTLYLAHPELAIERGLFDAATPEEISRLLPDASTALVEFVTTDRETVLITATRPAAVPAEAAPAASFDVQAHRIDIKGIDLLKQVSDLRSAMARRDQDPGKATRAMWDLLLEPARDELAGKTRVVIVPDGPLWAVPFQALQAPDGRYLIERCEVSCAPSLTALAMVERAAMNPKDEAGNAAATTLATPAGTARSLVAIAYPQPGSEAGRLALLNPYMSTEPIPTVVQEARSLGLIYGARRSKVYVERAATRDAILSGTSTTSVLHLAAFFVPSAASPVYSPFVLAAKPAGEDVVEAWELMETRLPETVVISRVQSQRTAGEARVPVALGWLFFVSGSRTLILPSWPDDSAGAVTLMLNLHRALAAPRAKPIGAAAALRQAVRQMLATPAYKHPFYWANYSVIGAR
jgi:CHAT domain-containing protein